MPVFLKVIIRPFRFSLYDYYVQNNKRLNKPAVNNIFNRTGEGVYSILILCVLNLR